MINPLDEELLEPMARELRFRSGLKHISKNKPLTIVDLGCGPKIRFYYQAIRSGISVNKYIGVDPLINMAEIDPIPSNTKIIDKEINKKLPIKTSSADILVGFAFLEHIDHPAEILRDSIRVLKPGGKAIFTTPTPRAKNILETLSFKLKIISRREIEEHKNYFTKESLISMLGKNAKSVEIHHQYFEFGCNNLLVLTKKST